MIIAGKITGTDADNKIMDLTPRKGKNTPG